MWFLIMAGIETFSSNAVLILHIPDSGNVNTPGKCLIMIFKKNSICSFTLGWVKSKYYKALKFKIQKNMLPLKFKKIRDRLLTSNVTIHVSGILNSYAWNHAGF